MLLLFGVVMCGYQLNAGGPLGKTDGSFDSGTILSVDSVRRGV